MFKLYTLLHDVNKDRGVTCFNTTAPVPSLIQTHGVRLPWQQKLGENESITHPNVLLPVVDGWQLICCVVCFLRWLMLGFFTSRSERKLWFESFYWFPAGAISGHPLINCVLHTAVILWLSIQQCETLCVHTSTNRLCLWGCNKTHNKSHQWPASCSSR